MEESSGVLYATAVTVGVVHTILGPDHYLPFVAMGRARRWSTSRLCAITAVCGVGHLVGSVALGLIGILAGTAVFTLESVESARGDIAGWMLIAFGLAYTAWGLRRALRNRPHSHWHTHADGTTHRHEHVHDHEHAHVHPAATPPGGDSGGAGPAASPSATITPWVLFTIFVFGPCEPLIPVLMYPAAKGRIMDVVLVTVLFGAATVGTMLAAVLFANRLSHLLRFPAFERFGKSLAGATVLACGLAVKLGL